MRNSFESCAAYLLPCDLVARKRTDQKHTGGATVAGTEGEKVTFGGKQGIEKTGVPLHYHTSDKYYQLTHEQKKELREWQVEWCASTGAGKRKPGSQKT
eukprot:3313463-Ditylum_brightwellii.AAC.1